MPDPKFIKLPEGYFAWTKKLGQRHYAKAGFDDETLCGMPMLGNNYSGAIPISDQTECQKCADKLSSKLSSSCPRCGTRFESKPGGASCPKCGTFVPEKMWYDLDILPEKSYSYAEMQFRIKTCQDVDTLKKVYALLDTSTEFTEFDKELLKEELAQRMQVILEHEEVGKPGAGEKFAEADADYSSFMETRENIALKELVAALKETGGELYQVNEKFPESPEGIDDDTPPQEDIKSWAVWAEIVDFIKKNGLKKWIDTEYAAHLDSMTAEELKLLRKIIEGTDDLTVSERLRIQEKIEQRLKPPMRDKDISKMSYAELHFLINTEQDTDELKRLYSPVDTLSNMTDFDKELLKEEIVQRMQRILEAEESAKEGGRPAAESVTNVTTKTSPAERREYRTLTELNNGAERKKKIFKELYEGWTHTKFQQNIQKTYSKTELAKLIGGIRYSEDIIQSEKRKLLDFAFERFKILSQELVSEGVDRYHSLNPKLLQRKEIAHLSKDIEDKCIPLGYINIYSLYPKSRFGTDTAILYDCRNTDSSKLKRDTIAKGENDIIIATSSKLYVKRFHPNLTEIKIKESVSGYGRPAESVAESTQSYDIKNIEDIKKIKLAALSGVKKIWVVNKGREGLILSAKYGKEWWEKASQDDIERITVYESSGEYELSDDEYNKTSKMSFDELISNNICPECKHRIVNGKCLLHGTREQILAHQPKGMDVVKETDDEIIQLIKKEQGGLKWLKCTTIKAFHKPGFTVVVMKTYQEGESIGSKSLYDINFKEERSAKRLEAKLKELFKGECVKESGSDELSIVETNLLNVGYDLRNDGRGHMVLPNGKGVSPTNHRGIVNHWEVIVDAGYLPSSNIFKLKHSPDMIVAGAINKGWRRWSGEASYEIRDLSKPNADFINMRLKQHFDNSGLHDAHIDVWSEGKYYNFDKATWDKSNHDILQVIKKVSPKSYQPAKAMDLKLMENEYIVRDPASIGDPDTWTSSKGAAFMDDIRGAHHGQVDGTLIAYDTKTSITIGYIDYSIFEGKLYLNSIEVGSSHRRQGYATALLLKLKKLNPGMPVKWGMMTELGCALKSAVDKQSPDNPQGVKVFFKGVLGEEHEKYRTLEPNVVMERRYVAEFGLVTRNMTCYKCGEMLQRKLNADQKTITCPSCQTQIDIKKAEELDKDLAARIEREQREGVIRERREYTKAERIAMAKAIASTIEKTTSETEGELCISLDNLSKLSKEERIRLAKKIAGGGTEVRSSVVRKGDDADNLFKDVKEDCSEWDFGTFEAMLPGLETQDDLQEMLECIISSNKITDAERETLRTLIEKNMEE